MDEETSAAAGPGKNRKLVLTLRAIDATHPEVIEEIRIEAGYFEGNAERMRYPKFCRQHLFVGASSKRDAKP